MTKSSKIFAVIAFTGFAMTAAGLVAAPFDHSASSMAGSKVSERIASAFSVVQPAIASPAPVQAEKGDLMLSPGCAGQTWPNISAGCLENADGMPVRDVRVVTIGHQTGAAETVLVRVPVAEIAMR